MPSSPGSWPVIMQLQAGTVIGGSTLRSGPQVPAPIRRLRFGSCSLQRSKASRGSAQSSPMTATLRLDGPLPTDSDYSLARSECHGVGPGLAVELRKQVAHDVLDGSLRVV